MIALYLLTVIIMIFGALWVVITKDVFRAIIISAVVSLSASVMFLFMHAPDVAITEAAIGAGMTTALFIFSYKKLEDIKNERR